MKTFVSIISLLICLVISANAADFMGATVEDRQVSTTGLRAGLKGTMPTVTGVLPGSVAELSGLQQGDVIIKVGESLAGRAAYLQNYIASAKSLTVLRGVERTTLLVFPSPAEVSPATLITSSTDNPKTKATPTVFVRRSHAGLIYSVVYTPDGKYVLSGSSDRTIKLWDVATGYEIRTFTGHSADVTSVAVSPNGKFVLSGSADKSLKLWDIDTGKVLRTFQHSEEINSVCFTPNGRHILSASIDAIKMWDINKGTLIDNIIVEYEYGRPITISPDGKYLLSRSKNSIYVYDLYTRKRIRSLTGHSKLVDAISFSPDGQRAISISGDDGVVKLWDTGSWREVHTYNIGKSEYKYGNRPCCFRYSKDSKRFFVVNKKRVSVWDISTGKCLKSFAFDGQMQGDLSPDERFIVSGSGLGNNYLSLWDVNTSSKLREFSHYSEIVRSVDISHNNRYLISDSLGGGFNVWDLNNGVKIRSSTGNKPSFVNGKDRIKYFNNDNLLLESDVVSEKQINTMLGYSKKTKPEKGKRVFIDALSEDYRIALLDGDDRIEVWDLFTGNIKKTIILDEPSSFQNSFALSHDGKYVLSSSWYHQNKLQLRNVTTGGKLGEMFGHYVESDPEFWDSRVTSLIYSPDDSKALSGSSDKTIKLWDLSNGKSICTLLGHTSRVSTLSFSSDGKYALSGSEDATIKLWNVESCKEIKTFRGHLGDISSVKFAANSAYLISGSYDNTFRLWDINSGKELAQFIAFNDGEWIVITPEGYFNASSNGAKYLFARDATKEYSIDQFHSSLYRPDLVQAKLNGQDISEHAKNINLEKILLGAFVPTVHFLTKSGIADNYDTTIQAKICDTGGGIGDVTLFLNDMPVAVETGGRGLKVVEKNRSDQCYSFERTITLSAGTNIIQLMAYNKANTIESQRDSIEILHNVKTAKPELHVLTVAVNAYRDGDLRLKYALPDADALAELIEQKAKGLFGKVHIHTLRDGDVTKEGLTQIFARIGLKMKREDVFLLFVAGHGITDEKEGAYYFLPADFRYTGDGAVQKQGVSMTDFRNMLANVQAMKSLILLDTCNSGSFAEAIASRGMTEKTAITKLSRAVGRATIVASSKSQVALEGYEGHGAFTWTILEGMKGKASDKGGKITINTLATFIEEELPKLTYKKWGYEQIPQKTLQGMDFQIGVR